MRFDSYFLICPTELDILFSTQVCEFVHYKFEFFFYLAGLVGFMACVVERIGLLFLVNYLYMVYYIVYSLLHCTWFIARYIVFSWFDVYLFEILPC